MQERPTRKDWDARYREAHGGPAAPARVLEENLHLLPRTGKALDLACGLGGNALCLAAHGLHTRAWDHSAVAIERLRAAAGEAGLAVECEVRDVLVSPPPVAGFDVITVSHFLERDLSGTLVDALRPGGLIFYQTFTRDRVHDAGPRRPEFRLGANELLELFRRLRVVCYREEGVIGDVQRGFRDEAMLVAQKRPD